MTKVSFFPLSVLLVLLSLIYQTVHAQPKDCRPVLAISSHNQYIKNLTVNKSDTVNVSVSCLGSCEIIAESTGIRITRLKPGRFIFTPQTAGENVVYFFSNCPEGTQVQMNGYNINMSGKRPITETTISCVK